MIKWQIYSLYTRLGFLILYLAMKSSFTLLQWTRVTQCARFDLYFSDASTERIYIYLKIDACGGNLYAWVATFHINEDWCFTFSQKKNDASLVYGSKFNIHIRLQKISDKVVKYYIHFIPSRACGCARLMLFVSGSRGTRCRL